MKTTTSLARLSLAAALGLALVAGPRRAEAGIFEFYVDAYGGGLYGTPKIAGIESVDPLAAPGTPNQGQDFFQNQTGGLLGGRVGIELLQTDLYLQFDQYFNGAGAAGSSLQLMLGWDGTIGCAAGEQCWGLLLGGYGGGVFGFPYTPKFPIDKAQIAGYGLALEGQIGAEYRINKYLRFQGVGTVGYHYLFGGSREITLTDNMGMTQVSATTTHGFHLLGKVGLRFNLGT